MEKINRILNNISKENNISIMFAVENGSRAWGMDSENSDYDVRFVYYRPVHEYLRITQPDDVIEYKDGEEIDMVGFDIFKFCKLLSKSNPTMIEWLMSDILYYGTRSEEFLNFVKEHWNPKALFYHYRSMGKQNYYKYIKSENYLSYKKYLYAMRGIINANTVNKSGRLPRMNFETEIIYAHIPTEVKKRLLKLIQAKKEGKENDIVGSLPVMDNFIERFLKETENVECSNHKPKVELLNKEIERLLI